MFEVERNSAIQIAVVSIPVVVNSHESQSERMEVRLSRCRCLAKDGCLSAAVAHFGGRGGRANGCLENSPALQCWESWDARSTVPKGRKNPSMLIRLRDKNGWARLVRENSPALQHRESCANEEQSPAGTKDPFCRPLRDFVPGKAWLERFDSGCDLRTAFCGDFVRRRGVGERRTPEEKRP